MTTIDEPAEKRRRGRLQQLGRRGRKALAFWTRSLLLRVIVLTLTFSAVVVVGVGLILQSQITERLLDAKRTAALEEVEKAASTVSTQTAGTDSDQTSLKEALQRTLDHLGNPSTAGTQASSAGTFDPVIAPRAAGLDDALTVGPIDEVPAELRARVAEGYIAWQYTTMRRDSAGVPGIAVGAPTVAGSTNVSVFLVFPLTFELSTVNVVQNTLLLGGAGLALALTVIAALVAVQVVGPVRRAAAVAGRLADGDLAERMPVRGPIELTTLARSFNSMADAIRAQIRQLEEFGKLQRQFTSDVSHELRTPVTTVRMAADFLHSSRDELPQHLSRSTELLVDELDRFESLLGDLLEISRHDAGMAELAAEPIDVRSLVTHAMSAAKPLADNVGVSLRSKVPPEPVVSDIDSRRVERILRNLLNNAIDHAEGRPVEVELAADDDAIAITVTDHGVGLKPGEAGLVFNRFWRADASRQRQTGGTGLGLAISLEDARLHGGWLQAWGESGVGARFRLTLPRRHGDVVDSSPLALRGDGDDSETDANFNTTSVPELPVPSPADPAAESAGVGGAGARPALGVGTRTAPPKGGQ